MQKERSYSEELKAQKDTYGQWIYKNEGISETNAPKKEMAWECLFQKALEKNIQVIPYGAYSKDIILEKSLLLFIAEEGIPALQIIEYVLESMKNPEVLIAYGDEDELSEEMKREEPWFKPDWSPNTLRSHFYIGSTFAIRRECITEKKGDDVCEFFYGVIEELDKNQKSMRSAIFHSAHIWYHREKEAVKWETYCNKEKQALLNVGEDMISIIIPSKDNPEILEKCIAGIFQKTLYSNYEVVVVDNGSSTENKGKIEKLKVKYKFNYIYSPMEFNFSKMCNLGVHHAKGGYILLLNDDMEIIQRDWLTLMKKEAERKDAGAVGAKLYYPNSNIIQHAGVTNLEIGPAHKLVTEADEGIIYHGVNTYVRDMLAVTAACLLVAKAKYEQVGGMCEELKVAYNDVDFCFSLYEAGYYNVQHNGVILYHHESLSRGDDITTAEKYSRLLQEKDKLYKRHPALYKKDPFYSKHLVINSPYYTCNFLYPFEDKTYFQTADKKNKKRILPKTFLHIHHHIDHAELEQKMETKDEEHYFVDGWSFVNKEDNAQFRTYLLFENEQKKYWRFPVVRRFREDVMPVAANQKNAGLSGFALRFRKGELPKGNYQIMILKKHLPTGSNHYCITDVKFAVE